MPRSTAHASAVLAQSEHVPASGKAARLCVLPGLPEARQSITASCSRVMLSIGAKRFSPTPCTMPLCCAHETAVEYHCPAGTSEKLPPSAAGLPEARQRIVASMARFSVPSGSKQSLPTPFMRPCSVTAQT